MTEMTPAVEPQQVRKSKVHWWMPVVAGAVYSLALPPFNHEAHWALSLFPLLGFFILLPLFTCATQPSAKRAVVHSYVYGYFAALGQFYWLVYDRVEGLWWIVLIGLLFISAVVACFYLVAAILFRGIALRFPNAAVLLFPAVWVLIDYSRTLGELAFPWAFLGYSFTPILPLAQLASVTGVWGLTYVIVLGNTIAWKFHRELRKGKPAGTLLRPAFIFCLALGSVAVAGWFRIRHYDRMSKGTGVTVSLVQSNIDALHWNNRSLDTAFDTTEALMKRAAAGNQDCIILPESSLLCFLTHRAAYRKRVAEWSRLTKRPIILGSLDCEAAPQGSNTDFFTYNSAFYVDTPSARFHVYHKIQLVPFSEAIPFQGIFPVLSRVNLGEADFRRGAEQTLFHIGGGIDAAPFICYESNFPAFVRQRISQGANLMVNITNDAWFGKSSGPYHHAMMARMRSIENGVTLARCANSGFSAFVDPVGRQLARTELYERTILTRTIPVVTLPTAYRRYGDWFVVACGISVGAGLLFLALIRRRRR
jgi:apolipoprotein N-acyltransferase